MGMRRMKRAAAEGTLPEGMRIPSGMWFRIWQMAGYQDVLQIMKTFLVTLFPATSGNAAFVEKAAPGNFRYFSINLVFCNSPSAWDHVCGCLLRAMPVRHACMIALAFWPVW
ncbi:hypothetical protein AA16373_2507 [Komagataeibacter swingsii DSM 16373]|nr:hypothetical protein AA16373_2507 [Komagataeibacter swingsii DSM 16373]